jgi:uncharacterized membrane protein YhaH (DUF805 family)
MSFGNAVSSFFSNYANFNGRARRSEYWFAYLFWVLVYLGTLILDLSGGGGLFTSLWALGTLIPLLALGVRRLHDTGRSGWNYLLGLIPFAGPIILLVLFVQDSVGPNQYGPYPKEAQPL